MSRMRQGMRTSAATNTLTSTARGSRVTGTSFGMGRNPRTSRSPKISGRF
jgi:hypothetical protein